MRIKFGDIILGLAVVAAAVLLLVSFKPTDAQFKTAVVTENGTEIKRINLFGLQQTEDIALLDGTEIVLQADNGRIRFIKSSCSDKTCIHTGWITGVGDMAVCLPNRVTVKITGGESNNDVDIIAQ